MSKNVKTKTYKTIILPLVLYGYLALREEHRMKVFEKGVLRRIFGRKRDGVIGGWRQLHNVELRNLYSSSNAIRTIKSKCMRWTGPVARMREMRNAYRVFVGNPDGKKPP
jgi:hypothetical protein